MPGGTHGPNRKPVDGAPLDDELLSEASPTAPESDVPVPCDPPTALDPVAEPSDDDPSDRTSVVDELGGLPDVVSIFCRLVSDDDNDMITATTATAANTAGPRDNS